MQIQTIEEKTGLDRATIRYYEKEGLIQPQRLANGYRDYSQAQLEELMKIKLLRQLGLSLETIQQLIEGKEELKSALDDQLVILNVNKEQIDSAEAICKMILQDEVTYQTFKPHKYIAAIDKKCHKENRIIDTPNREYECFEAHPFRRFIGRYIDQILTHSILILILVVFMRVRPFSEMHIRVLSVAVLFLVMPVDALFLCLFGTTPGKLAVGVFIKDSEGKNLSFLAALKREWTIFRYGMGYNLPILSWIRMIQSYRIHTRGEELDWDYDAEVIYRQCGIWKWAYGVLLCVFCIFTIFYSTVDSQFPKHRNSDLTIIQFAENFNVCARQNNMSIRLSEKGEWYDSESAPVLIYDEMILGDDPWIEETWNFETDDNQIIQSIQMQTNSSFYYINSRLEFILYTVLISQPDADLNSVRNTMQEFTESMIKSDMNTTQYNFDGIIMNITKQYGEDESVNTFVEIILP